jgi:hypothetical protein
MVLREACPQSASTWDKKNGHLHTDEQNHRGKAGGRAFVLVPEPQVMTDEQRARSERLLLESIARRGSCRAMGVGRRGLFPFMVKRFKAAPEPL